MPGTSRANGEVELSRHEAVTVNPSDILSKWEEDNLLREYPNIIHISCLLWFLGTQEPDDGDDNETISYEDLESGESFGISRLTTD